MNALIIYDSAFGNTKRLAEIIAAELQTRGKVRLVSVAEASILDTRGIDLLVFGSPTQLHGLSPLARALISNIPHGALDGVALAAFDTRYRTAELLSGSAADDIARVLKAAGATLIVPAKSFFVVDREGPLDEEEPERAKKWAEVIFERYGMFKRKYALV